LHEVMRRSSGTWGHTAERSRSRPPTCVDRTAKAMCHPPRPSHRA